MKAVNLIPSDSQRSGAKSGRSLQRSPGLVPLGLLAVALAFVTVYVLTANTINDRKAKLATTQTQLSRVQAQAAQLQKYVQFEQLAQARVQTVQQIANSRFDWEGALTELSQVVPANASLQLLLGTVSPDTSVGGNGGGGVPSSQSLRAAIDAPAFALHGCTKSHDDVARLMSRLRVMDDVQRVSLATTAKGDSTSAGSALAGPVGCGKEGPNAATFDLIVFFKPLPGQGATNGTGGAAATPGTTSATTSTTAGSTTAAATPGTTTQQTSTTSATTASGGTPVSGSAQ